MTKTLQLLKRSRWLATWLQGRRRKRQGKLLRAPVLRAAFPDLLRWDWSLPNPFKWNVWMSLDNGASWMLVEDYWMYGDARQFAPDGGSELYYIVGIDQTGKEITQHSNIIRPDDALMPAPVLRAAYPSLLQWDWTLTNPFKWNVWMSLDNGANYMLVEDYWAYGSARQFAPDGGSEFYYIVGVNQAGQEITEHSNAVRPDDAPAPVAAPVIDESSYGWNGGDPSYADIEIGFSFNHGSYPTASLEVWVSRDGGAFVLLATVDSFNSYFLYDHATENEASFDFKLRYVNGSVVGPFSNVMHVNVQV